MCIFYEKSRCSHFLFVFLHLHLANNSMHQNNDINMKRVYLFSKILVFALLATAMQSCEKTRESKIEDEFIKYVNEEIYDKDDFIGIEAVLTVDTFNIKDIRESLLSAGKELSAIEADIRIMETKTFQLLEKYGEELFIKVPNSKRFFLIYDSIAKERYQYVEDILDKKWSLVDSDEGDTYIKEIEKFKYVDDANVYVSMILARMKDGPNERIDTFYCYTDEKCKSFDFTGLNTSLLTYFDEGIENLDILYEMIKRAREEKDAANDFLRTVFDYERGH